MASLDSFKCRQTLTVGDKTYVYYSLPLAEQNGLAGISKLPFSMKVLLENLLRFEDGGFTVSTADRMATLGSAIPRMWARSMAFWTMSRFVARSGLMFMAASATSKGLG